MHRVFFRILFGILCLPPCSPALATEWLGNYLSGVETCAKHAEALKGETGTRTEVPIDYDRPESGTVSIYSWFLKPFDPAKPTLVFFPGGPGASSHGAPLYGAEEGWNVLYFDQRGISCSKPATVDLYRSPTFYSSEYTARDLEGIRQKLDIPVLSVYGHSYGTVPATIYTSLHPEHTRALVLEGTIVEGGRRLYQNARLVGMIQSHFDSLPSSLREKIIALSRAPGIAPEWYSRVNHFMMYLDDSFRLLDGWLQATFETPGLDPAVGVSSFADFPQSEEEFGFGLVMHAMIGCRELGMAAPEATFYSVFDDHGRLVSDRNPRPQNRLCEEFGVAPAGSYAAARYPVTVPVTYFQGEYDGATELTGATRHFETVPQGFAQFLLLERGGHLPNLALLQERREGDEANALQKEIFSEAVRAREVSPELLVRSGIARGHSWVRTIRSPHKGRQ